MTSSTAVRGEQGRELCGASRASSQARSSSHDLDASNNLRWASNDLAVQELLLLLWVGSASAGRLAIWGRQSGAAAWRCRRLWRMQARLAGIEVPICPYSERGLV